MPATLTATPLPDSAAVRLHLSASVPDYPTVLSETLQGLPADAVNATASRWTPYGLSAWTITSDTGGNALSLRSGAYLGTGAARTYGFRRTLTGLTAGRRYLAYLGIRTDSGTVVEVSVDGVARAMPTTNDFDPVTGAWAVGERSSGPMPHTAYVFDFVANGPTALLQFTNRDANAYVGVGFLWIRVVPVLAAALVVQNGFAADDAGVTMGGTVPAGIVATRTYEPVGNVTAVYTAPSGSATLPSGSVYLTKTLTGLTIGQRYRLTTAASGARDGSGGPSSGGYRLLLVETGDSALIDGSTLWAAVEFVATATSHTFRLIHRYTDTIAPGDRVAIRFGYYRLDSVPAADDALSVVQITRSDVNGVRPVRLYEGADLSNGELITTDHEAALVGLVVYQATVRNLLTSGTETAQASATLQGVDRSRIAPASMPQAGAWYDLAPDLELGRETTTTLAQVINRDDPLVTLGSQTSRRGRMSIFAEDYQRGAALEQVFNRGEIVLIRQPDHPGLDMYVVGTRTSLVIQRELTNPRRWVLSFDYTEVAPPSTPLLGTTGWTIAASLARNPTLAASRAEFRTVLDLLIGPTA